MMLVGGSVMVDGRTAPDGTSVEVSCGGGGGASTQTSGGIYRVTIFAYDPNTPGSEGFCRSGASLSFDVNGQAARASVRSGSARFSPLDAAVIDLSIGSSGPSVTPTPSHVPITPTLIPTRRPTTTQLMLVGGSVTVDGRTAPDGTSVEVSCGGGGGASTQTSGGIYRVTIFGYDPNTPGSEGFCRSGGTLSFDVNGQAARASVRSGSARFSSPDSAVIDLSIGSSGPSVPPPPTSDTPAAGTALSPGRDPPPTPLSSLAQATATPPRDSISDQPTATPVKGDGVLGSLIPAAEERRDVGTARRDPEKVVIGALNLLGDSPLAPPPALVALRAVELRFFDEKLREEVPLVGRPWHARFSLAELGLPEDRLGAAYLFQITSEGRWAPLLSTIDPTTGDLVARATQPTVAAMMIAADMLRSAELDYSLPVGVSAGRFFTQGNGRAPGQLPLGFAVADIADGPPFWSEFQRLGGVEKLGYPISRPAPYGGSVIQLMEKGVLQWLPGEGQMAPLETLDELHNLGLDSALGEIWQIPERAAGEIAPELRWEGLVERHPAAVDAIEAIIGLFAADSDLVAHYGLPTALSDTGDMVVVRAQRAAFQFYRVEVPWAAAGEAIMLGGGELFKQLALQAASGATGGRILPLEVLTPELPPGIAEML